MKKYFQAPWSLKEVLRIFLISGILMFLVALGLYLSPLRDLIKESSSKSIYLLGVFVLQWGIILVPLLWITRKKHKLKWKHFGFKKISPYKTILLIIGGYLMFLGVALIVSIIIIFFNVKIPGYQIQKDIIPLFGNDLLSLIIAGGVIVVLGPIIEEIFFRGFLLRALSNKWGVIYGSIISAAIFAIFHLQPQSIIPIFILGLIINSMVIHSKSIWPAIGFHILNNGIVFIFEVLILKGIIRIDQFI